jgi:hypothetical protein
MGDLDKGQKLAVAMLDGAEEVGPASHEDMFNAVGTITVATFSTLPLCKQHQLEEFDSWVAYTRKMIAEAP